MSTKVLSNQRVTVLAGPAAGVSSWAHPLLADLTELENISEAVNWDSFDLNLQGSEQNDDRTLTDGAGAQSRGFTNFGGTLQLVSPPVGDTASKYKVAYDILSDMRVELVVAVRYGKLNSQAPAAGDRWYIYHVMTDATAFGQNDVSKFYSVTLIARDDVLPNYIVPAASPATIVKTILDASVAVGDLVFISSEYEGWDITKSAEYVISDETKLVMVHPGIFRAIATGAPTVTVKYPGATSSTAGAVTIA
jgi:hypothetical protein